MTSGPPEAVLAHYLGTASRRGPFATVAFGRGETTSGGPRTGPFKGIGPRSNGPQSPVADPQLTELTPRRTKEELPDRPSLGRSRHWRLYPLGSDGDTRRTRKGGGGGPGNPTYKLRASDGPGGRRDAPVVPFTEVKRLGDRGTNVLFIKIKNTVPQ